MSRPETKKCTGPCQQELPLSDFCKKRSAKDGLGHYCRECKSRRAKKDYTKNKDGVLQRCKKYYATNKNRILSRVKEYGRKNRMKINQQKKKYTKTKRGREITRGIQLLHRYGITLEQHKQMYVDQDGRCGICGEAIAYSRTFTDHDHESGKVRGLLCLGCNTALGHFGDTLEGVQRVINYLRKKK